MERDMEMERVRLGDELYEPRDRQKRSRGGGGFYFPQGVREREARSRGTTERRGRAWSVCGGGGVVEGRRGEVGRKGRKGMWEGREEGRRKEIVRSRVPPRR